MAIVSQAVAERTLASSISNLQNAQLADQIDPDDPLVYRITSQRERLQRALKTREDLTSMISGSTSERDSRGLFDSLLSMFERKPRPSPAERRLVRVDQAITLVHGQLSSGLTELDEISSMRSCYNPMGAFYTLLDRNVLVTKGVKRSYSLKGRYEQTGKDLRAVVVRIEDIGKQIKVRSTISGLSRQARNNIGLWLGVQKSLAVVCDLIISHMLIAPFDNCTHERAIMNTSLAVKEVQKFLDGDDTVTVDGLKQKINEIDKDVSEKSDKYLSDAEIFNEEEKRCGIKASERSFEHLDLKPGDLLNTALVVQRITTAHEKKGLGINEICSGPPLKTGDSFSGGYGHVCQTLIPDNAVGLDSVKTSKRAVAVKIAKAKPDVAEANLRMLREADRWSAVSRDPRKSGDGREFIAEVLGVWNNFLNGRPGLISLWGEFDLSSYIRDTNPSTRRKLEILFQIAQGVNYLHSCTPVIVHGDLKATNVIMVDEKPRLTDFGVSKVLDGIRNWTTGNTYTDDYRAPELQYRNVSLVRDPTTKSDVYAFGCVLFETLSGKSPYDGYSKESRKESIDKHDDCSPVDAENKRPTGKPFGFEESHLELMNKCFAFHASKRPPMATVAKDLEQICRPAKQSLRLRYQ